MQIIDQTKLPHLVQWRGITNVDTMARAIKDMWVRGAPLIGASAAYGMWLALRGDPSDRSLAAAKAMLAETRPTAVNLSWALRKVEATVKDLPEQARARAALKVANQIAEHDISVCRAIGEHGLPLLQEVAKTRGRVAILTHCNAGRLATVAWGTATSPMYLAKAQGLDVHVYISETRPRNQGSSLTAWELADEGISFEVVADNAAAWLMAEGKVDMVLIGTDRVAANGDVANKIGTCLKALAAKRYDVPFYVAAPTSSIDTSCDAGPDIPIECRDEREVTHIQGMARGEILEIALSVPNARALNPAFDVTPADVVTGLITEHGIVAADKPSIAALMGES